MGDATGSNVVNVSEQIEVHDSTDEPHVIEMRSPSPSRNQAAPRSVSSVNKRKRADADELDEDKDDQARSAVQNDAEVCPICLEEWTNSGQHRLVATECGHLFGKMFVRMSDSF